MAKRVGAAAAAFTISLVGVMVTSTSAQAAASECGSGNMCLFDGANYTGGLFRIKDRNEYGGLCDHDLGDNYYDNGKRVVDSASSVINNTHYRFIMYENPAPYHADGYQQTVSEYNRTASLSQVHPDDQPSLNNKVSAVC